MLKPDELFQMAARINKKRSFLFVSKVLGKHIPIHPSTGLVCGALLADRYLSEVKGDESGKTDELLSAFLDPSLFFEEEHFISTKYNPLIIGFAETATALGHTFFNAFSAGDYFHTTREMVDGRESVISFEEEHSHATSHRSYIDVKYVDNNREIILVDDEITTGKTALNIINSIHQQFPRKEYTVVSILDWRTEEHKRQFDQLQAELGVTINCVSLMSGNIQLTGSANIDEKQAVHPKENQTGNYEVITLTKHFPNLLETVPYTSINTKAYTHTRYLSATGRFGLSAQSNHFNFSAFQKMGDFLQSKRSGNRTLTIGTGEFMYLPMKIASYMGDGIYYHSTTRSPIYPCSKDEYGVQNAYVFPNPEDHNITNYVYNIPAGKYDDAFIFFEREMPEQHLLPFLKEIGSVIPDIKIVYLSGEEGK